MGLGATSLTTVMQMVANGYGVTLVPEVAIDVEVRDERVKLLRFAPPQRAARSGSHGGAPPHARSISLRSGRPLPRRSAWMRRNPTAPGVR